MKEKIKTVLSRAAPRLCAAVGRTVRIAGIYFDDLLFLASGACFIIAAERQWGRTAALAVAGAFLLAFAAVVAGSRRGR